MIDRHELLATLKPLVAHLEESIRERALATAEVAAHLEQEHHKAIAAGRTAMSLEEWRDGEITQAAVAWVLGCVFVRFLEDNGLIDQPLISGPGERRAAALGFREEHFRAHPEHSDREYLEACFRTVALFPAVAPLYDERHNPLWRLGPTADGAEILRSTFTAIQPATGILTHDFTDPNLSTRFLGDLYQDLSEAAKKRYALLQTPEFVEHFILDRTLTPAINEFGLDEVRLIDPTCGSGHFLLGAFERLFERWQEREPGSESATLAQRCLDHIAGVDLNPYAIAIARFRLVIKALKVCEIRRLAEAPAFQLQLATGDSLLHGPLPHEGATMLFDRGRFDRNIAHVYESEDATELRAILGRGYHAVVGNPPYIAVADAALRDAYRARYASCHGAFVLTVPFMERFFELAKVPAADGRVRAGYVGKITGNNFMKREFGSRLVEGFCRSVDIQTVVDTSGAYIPGHGTPTVLIFGRSRSPQVSTLRVVDGLRGEPGQPDVPSRGVVWSSIVAQADAGSAEDRFVRTSTVERSVLFTHPMVIGAGRELKLRLEAGRPTLSSVITDSGFGAVTRENEVYELPPNVARARGIPAEQTIALVGGDDVRDWDILTREGALWPYDRETLEAFATPELRRFLWPWRQSLRGRVAYGKTQIERGLEWFEYSMFFAQRYAGPTISWAFVSTHNHFALGDPGKTYKQTAPILKFAPNRTQADLLSLLGALNSSVACFWLKQVCQNRGTGTDSAGARMRGELWSDFFDHDAGKVTGLPLPTSRSPQLSEQLHELAHERAALLSHIHNDQSDEALAARLRRLARRDRSLAERLVSLQEELDWGMLRAYGLVSDDLPILGTDAPPISLGQRAFEIVLAAEAAKGEIDTTWFVRHGSVPLTEIPADWPEAYREVVRQRIALIVEDPDVGLIERPEHKRRWSRPPWEELQREALTQYVLDALDDAALWSDLRPRSTSELTDRLRVDADMVEALELLTDQKDSDLAGVVRQIVVDAAVPHLAAQRLTEKGLRKRRAWEQVWAIQRAEDSGQEARAIALPPKYAQGDFRAATFWKHRGKLDVPKERFVLIPHAERGADPSPVVGWAGWDERDLARALAGRVMELREQEAVGVDRVTPLLAGVLELLPWIRQWHPASEALYGGPPGEYFDGWLDGQLAELAITRENLREWRPPTSARGRKAKAGAA